MPQTAIRSNIYQPLDVHVDFGAKSTLNFELLLNNGPNLGYMILC